jgi:nitroimidazol reductase NimA-like FMN-containing flavoprotein (pyridoxamine 5'-phosphate oxidase superfamily)
MKFPADPSSLREFLRGMLRTQRLAVLGTSGPEGPHCSLVAFAEADDLKTLLFATSRATGKYSHIMRDPRVSVLIDTRTNTAEDFRDAAAVTAVGTAAEATGPERDRFAAVYLEKHPELADFIGAPECGVMKVSVATYRVVTRFEQVSVLPAGD